MTTDRSAIGFVFAVGGMAAILAPFLLTHYGPVLREFIHWLITPQFVMGMFLMSALIAFGAVTLARDWR